MSTPRPRVRWQIVVAACVAGTLLWQTAKLVLPRLGGGQFAYDASFDANIAATAPHVVAALKADPALRRMMVDRTGRAYAQGGWPAASGVFWHIVHSDIQAFASDETTNACLVAWRDLYRALQARPDQCRLEIDGRYDVVAGDAAAPEFARMNDACGAAIEDGGRRRLSMHEADIPAPAQFDATWHRIYDGSGADHSDAAQCAGQVQSFEKILALGPHDGAAFLRYQLASESNEDFMAAHSADARREVAPADFSCAPAGTVFVLSMFAADGRPITWTSHGQKGFDCALNSSVTGDRFLWHDASYERAQLPQAHALRALWPLAAGKTGHFEYNPADGEDTQVDYRVLGFNQYWFPWGYVGAWAIERHVREDGGKRDYVATDYWAPSLAWKMGQNTVVKRGGWPDGEPPNWQVIAVQRPNG